MPRFETNVNLIVEADDESSAEVLVNSGLKAGSFTEVDIQYGPNEIVEEDEDEDE